MTGPEHYRAAELLLLQWSEASTHRAQVHATLALAAATALGLDDLPAADWDEWRAASATAPPKNEPSDASPPDGPTDPPHQRS